MNNITIIVPGLGHISVSAYNELKKLVMGYDHSEDIFNSWEYNQHFIPAMVSYFRAIGRKNDAELIKNCAMKMVWSFENGHLQSVCYAPGYPAGVYVVNHENVEEYYNSVAWEVIRDFCLPVVMDYV